MNPDQFKQMIQWSAQNSSDPRAKEFQSRITSGRYNNTITEMGLDPAKFGVKMLTVQEEQPGFVQSTVQGMASPFLKVATTVKDIGKAGFGLAEAGVGKLTGSEELQKKGMETALEAGKPTDYGYFGKVSPLGTTKEGEAKSFGQTAQESAGVGTELASWLVGSGGAASTAEQIAKQNVWKALGEAVKAGAKIGGLGSLGVSLQKQADEGKFDLGKTALETGIGTAAGGVLGGITGGLAESPRMVQKLSEEGAPRFINSLIKPLAKDFSYGKNPGAAIAEEKIIANNFDDLISKINQARQNTGQQLQQSLSQIPDLKVNLVDSLSFLDNAAKNAAKSNDTTLLNRINNVKTAITNDLILKDGQIVSAGERDLSNVPANEIPNLYRLIGDMTKWTMNKTEDSIVNKSLKQTYSSVQDKMLNAIKEVNPELSSTIEKLNDKYSNLITAENAAKYRDILNQRSSLIGFSPMTTGIGTAITTAILSGGQTIPAVIAGLGAAGLEKFLETPAAKTRIAATLQTLANKQGINAVENLASKIPALSSTIKEFISKKK